MPFWQQYLGTPYVFSHDDFMFPNQMTVYDGWWCASFSCCHSDGFKEIWKKCPPQFCRAQGTILHIAWFVWPMVQTSKIFSLQKCIRGKPVNYWHCFPTIWHVAPQNKATSAGSIMAASCKELIWIVFGQPGGKDSVWLWSAEIFPKL